MMGTGKDNGEGNKLQAVKEFIEKAKKLGKYPRNTAVSRLSALKVVEEGLTGDEPQTPEYILNHVEEIFGRQAHKLNLNDGSLRSYISRVRGALEDFQRYGTAPGAIISWKPFDRPREKTREERTESNNLAKLSGSDERTSFSPDTGRNLKIVTWSLRPQLEIQVQLPRDFNLTDLKRLNRLLELEAELTAAAKNASDGASS